MRHAMPPRLAQRRAALRRGLGPRRPRTPIASQTPQDGGKTRVSDIVLGMLAVTLLGALALLACAAVAGRLLAP